MQCVASEVFSFIGPSFKTRHYPKPERENFGLRKDGSEGAPSNPPTAT